MSTERYLYTFPAIAGYIKVLCILLPQPYLCIVRFVSTWVRLLRLLLSLLIIACTPSDLSIYFNPRVLNAETLPLLDDQPTGSRTLLARLLADKQNPRIIFCKEYIPGEAFNKKARPTHSCFPYDTRCPTSCMPPPPPPPPPPRAGWQLCLVLT